MKNLLSLVLILCLCSLSSFSKGNKPKEFKLFYLGGQSNMDGYGYVKELPDSLTSEIENVWIFHGNPSWKEDNKGGYGLWEKIKPGHGVGFSSDGSSNKLSERFGAELSFAKKLRELYPNDNIAIIKYSAGGTSIDSIQGSGSWDADFIGTLGINQYDYFLRTIKSATTFPDIDGDENLDTFTPCGIAWMQGESDAVHSEEIALRYFDNLKRLMDLIRASLRKDDIPVAIGKISDSGMNEKGKIWKYGELVQYAEEKYAKTDRKAAIIRNTKYYKYSDAAHYDSNGYIDLGKAFADAIYKLSEK